LQTLLLAKGMKISVDGEFGPKTAAALKQFQEAITGWWPTGHLRPDVMGCLEVIRRATASRFKGECAS
jgi:hypothetical protein